MTLRVSGKNLDIGDALKTHVEGRVGEALSKYVEGGYSGHVTVRKEGTAFRTDCLIHLRSGLTLQAESVAHNPHASVELAAERLTRRVKRYKHRIRTYHDGLLLDGAGEAATDYVIEAPAEDEESDEAPQSAGDFTPVIIAERVTRMRRLSVSEAVID